MKQTTLDQKTENSASISNLNENKITIPKRTSLLKRMGRILGEISDIKFIIDFLDTVIVYFSCRKDKQLEKTDIDEKAISESIDRYIECKGNLETFVKGSRLGIIPQTDILFLSGNSYMNRALVSFDALEYACQFGDARYLGRKIQKKELKQIKEMPPLRKKLKREYELPVRVRYGKLMLNLWYSSLTSKNPLKNYLAINALSQLEKEYSVKLEPFVSEQLMRIGPYYRRLFK